MIAPIQGRLRDREGRRPPPAGPTVRYRRPSPARNRPDGSDLPAGSPGVLATSRARCAVVSVIHREITAGSPPASRAAEAGELAVAVRDPDRSLAVRAIDRCGRQFCGGGQLVDGLGRVAGVELPEEPVVEGPRMASWRRVTLAGAGARLTVFEQVLGVERPNTLSIAPTGPRRISYLWQSRNGRSAGASRSQPDRS